MTHREVAPTPELLAERFRMLERETISPHADYATRLDIRRTFMAGAAAVFETLFAGASEGTISPDEVMRRMNAMADELEQFDLDFHRGLV